MAIRGLAEFFAIKYAGNDDMEGGFPTKYRQEIEERPDDAKRRMVRAFEKAYAELSSLPIYQMLERDFPADRNLFTIKSLIASLPAISKDLSPIGAEIMAKRILQSLDKVKLLIMNDSKYSRAEALTFDTAITNVAKDLAMEIKKLRAWQYAPVKSLTPNEFNKNRGETPAAQMKRLENETLEEEYREGFDPYHSELEKNLKTEDYLQETNNKKEKAHHKIIITKHDLKRKYIPWMKGYLGPYAKGQIDKIYDALYENKDPKISSFKKELDNVSITKDNYSKEATDVFERVWAKRKFDNDIRKILER